MKELFRQLYLRSKGFTLVELLIVIAIVGVLGAVILPRVSVLAGSGQQEAAQAEAAAVQVALDTMIAKLSLTSVTPSGSAVNDMSVFPDAIHPLYPDYLRCAATRGTYSTDSTGKITQVSSGYSGAGDQGSPVSPPAVGGSTTDVYYSDTFTQVTGPLTTAPVLPINAGSYSWSDASIVSSLPSTWTNISGAEWISTTSLHSGVETSNEGDAWRLFKTTFVAPLKVTEAQVYLAADNAFEFYLNGTKIASSTAFPVSAPVYGTWPGGGSTLPFTTVWIYNITPVTGTNTLTFVLRNWNNNGSPNPSGLIYQVSVTSE